jgi:midasin (ATPase involved in ribosome maturation)
MTYGPFIEAFRDGHCLHLDEINLAPVSVLQCIEEALDTKVLIIEIIGLPLQKFVMHPNFCLIATQNRRTKLYKDKRESAGIKFLSKFQIVNFEEFTKDELIKIAKGMRDNIIEKKDRIAMDDNDITKLIDFHLELSKIKINDYISFTLRQIESCIEAFSKGENMYNIIYNVYGKIHQQQQKFEEMILEKFDKKVINKDLPAEFPTCFKTKSIQKFFNQVDFSFKNGNNVIIIGKKGCGKTQFALWMAEYYNKKYVDKKYEKSDVDLIICTDETSCADLIGKQILSKKKESGQQNIEWNYGFLLNGIKEGKCLVFDNINEISSQITERANNLFDLNLNSEKDLYFEVPENPNKKEQKVKINKTFRVIATCDENRLDKMSPAFINRFNIILYLYV